MPKKHTGNLYSIDVWQRGGGLHCPPEVPSIWFNIKGVTECLGYLIVIMLKHWKYTPPWYVLLYKATLKFLKDGPVIKLSAKMWHGGLIFSGFCIITSIVNTTCQTRTFYRDEPLIIVGGCRGHIFHLLFFLGNEALAFSVSSTCFFFSILPDTLPKWLMVHPL